MTSNPTGTTDLTNKDPPYPADTITTSGSRILPPGVSPDNPDATFTANAVKPAIATTEPLNYQPPRPTLGQPPMAPKLVHTPVPGVSPDDTDASPTVNSFKPVLTKTGTFDFEPPLPSLALPPLAPKLVPTHIPLQG